MENLSRPQEKIEDDENLDQTLRPKSWEGYIGQNKVKENIKIIIEAAKRRGEPIEHLLFYGGSGLGKTTISHIIAHEL